MIDEYTARYYMDADCDGDEDDIEPTKHIHVKCVDCGIVELYSVTEDEMREFRDNGDGTYTTPYEQCAACIDG